LLKNFLEEVFPQVKRKALPIIAALALLSFPALLSASAIVRAQSTTPAPPTSPAPPSAAQAPEPTVGFSTNVFDEGNFLGVHAEDITRETAARYGVSGEPNGVGIGVREVVKGSPAERAGLREGDVIVRFDGEQVTSVRKLTRLIEESAPKHAARLTVRRSGAEQELSATLGRREPFMLAGTGDLTVTPFDPQDALRLGEEFKDNPELWQLKGDEMREKLEEMQRKHPGMFAIGSSRRIGVSTSLLGKQLADYFGVGHGVLVNSVEANSPAERAGLKAGDVLTEADGQQIDDASDLVRALSSKDEGEVTLTFVRERKQRTVRVTPERRQPQSLNLTPGSMRLGVPPVVSVMPPVVTVTPRVVTIPRAMVAPRVRVRPSRITVLHPGDRVL
jgi:membrane-associated protease RseP (regulator of RpoE activity)